MIPGFQHHVIAGTVKGIAVRGGNLGHIVVAQRQQFALIRLLTRGDDRIRQLACLEPDGAVLSNNVLHRSDLEHSTLEVSGSIDR